MTKDDIIISQSVLPDLPDPEYTITEQVGVLANIETFSVKVFTAGQMITYAKEYAAREQRRLHEVNVELLESCIALLSITDSVNLHGVFTGNAREAIAKATGKTE